MKRYRETERCVLEGVDDFVTRRDPGRVRRAWRRRVVGVPLPLVALLASAMVVAAAVFFLGPPSNQTSTTVSQITASLVAPGSVEYGNFTGSWGFTVGIASNTFTASKAVSVVVWLQMTCANLAASTITILILSHGMTSTMSGTGGLTGWCGATGNSYWTQTVPAGSTTPTWAGTISFTPGDPYAPNPLQMAAQFIAG